MIVFMRLLERLNLPPVIYFTYLNPFCENEIILSLLICLVLLDDTAMQLFHTLTVTS